MSSIHYQDGFKVRPLGTSFINQLTEGLRREFEVTGYLDVIHILEFEWRKYEIRSTLSMGGNLGLSQPDGTILLRQDVYDGACDGDGFHRFTVAHELGHVAMHLDQIGFARAFSQREDKVYQNSEWQANEFAGSFLVPAHEIKSAGIVSVEEVVEKYGVSPECAQLRLKKIWRY